MTRRMVGTIAGTVLALGAAGAWGQPSAGEWSFSSEAPTIADASGNGSLLRHEGCQWVTGKRGRALSVPLRGGRAWCDSPGQAVSPATAVGIIAWVRPMVQARYRGILDHGSGWGEGNKGYRLLLYGPGVRFMTQANKTVNLTGGATVQGQWHQVAASYDGKEAALFLDGQQVRSEPLTGALDYGGVEKQFQVGTIEGQGLGGEIFSLRVFGHGLTPESVAADFEAGKGLRLSPEELTAEKYNRLTKCSLRTVPQAPFVRDRHTTFLAHLDAAGNADADYSRWEGRAGGGEMRYGAPGRFGSAVELLGEGAPILYRGGANCSLDAGTCEFWMQAVAGDPSWSDTSDRYLLTIIPEWHVGYGDRPNLHLCLRKEGLSCSLQLAASTEPISWYDHLSGKTIADTAGTVLDMPIETITRPGWHHVLCSWMLAGRGRVWLIVDGQGVSAELAREPSPLRAIPCYKIFLGGSYFPEVYCPTARAAFDEFRLLDVPVTGRLAGQEADRALPAQVDEKLMMRCEDACRFVLDFTARLQMGGGWECVYTWPNLMPDESPGSYAAVAEDDYTMRYIIPAYLRAYEVLGDDRYLRVAEQCGQMLVQTQDKGGAWCQGYMVMPDGYHPVSPGAGSIEEGTQTDPLRVLFWLWRLTGRQEYREAAVRSARFVLGAQKPDGAWPLTCNSVTMAPGGGYSGYSTLNDGTTTWGMKAMLMGWHLTGDRAYLDALVKAGDWMVRSVLRGKAVGWAEQYGDDGKPAWARSFEPPAVCCSAISDAAEGLLLMYDLTADRKYLAPLRECIAWGQSLLAERKTHLYYDPVTGDPVAARDYKVYRFGEPGFAAAVQYRTSADYFDRLDRRVKAREDNGPLVWSIWPDALAWNTMSARSAFEQQPPTPERLARWIDADRQSVAQRLEVLEKFARGEFPAGQVTAVAPRHGRHFWPGQGAIAALPVLDDLQCARALVGDMDVAGVPRVTDEYLGYIDPARDWYKTPLLPDTR